MNIFFVESKDGTCQIVEIKLDKKVDDNVLTREGPVVAVGMTQFVSEQDVSYKADANMYIRKQALKEASKNAFVS